jgi:hypothetical protein
LRPAASTAGNGDDRIARLRVLPAARDAALFGRIETARQLDRTPAPDRRQAALAKCRQPVVTSLKQVRKPR